MSQILYIFCDMDNGYIKLIRERIDSFQDGYIFTYSDFSDLGIKDSSTIRQSLSRLLKEKKIIRIRDGFFYKPIYSKILDEILPPSPENFAYAIARKFKWNIIPCGDVALNLLGISTQIPADWTYLSDGPYRHFDLDNFSITFKHRTNREISGMSKITGLIIQALKTLNKENVTDEVIHKISTKINSDDKKKILAESIYASDWIKNFLHKICED